MESDWSPEGYQTAKTYEGNDWGWLSVASLLLLPAYLLSRGPISAGVESWVPVAAEAAIDVFPNYDDGIVVLILLLVTSLGFVVSIVAIIPVHELVHYLVSRGLGLRPQPFWSESLGVPNPSIVPMEPRITRTENLLGLMAPFVVLDLILGLIMFSTSGIIAAVAAGMFAVNTVASCADIYNSITILRMPAGTLFANEITDGDLRTEYVFPETD